ncbi:MAG: hypothetical protein ACWA6R_10225 [Nitrosomonas sp.]
MGDKQIRPALQLIALIFVRSNELIKASWEEIDFKNALWIIPAARMKKRKEHVTSLTHNA